MPTELSDLRVVEISLVRRPANRRPLLLLKSEDDPMPDPNETKIEVDAALIPVVKALLVAGADEETVLGEVLKQGLSDEEQNKVRMALRLLAGLKGKLPEAAMKALAGAAGYGYPPPMEKKEEPVKTQLIKSEDGREFSVPETAAPVVEALLKSESELRKSLDAEIATRKQRDALAKATKEYPHLDPQKTAGLLLKSAALGEEYQKDLDLTLKQAEALAATGATKPVGADGGGGSGGDAMSKIEARATELRKSEASISQEQAVSRVLRTPEGKALYQEHLAEQRAARH